ncbi:hypothetical protein GJAV_G00188590 [Gymnothorax javanicus]|nr:hypothetical protein GJAV_G00188590 [Gymnothorax javanicus]
MISNITIYCILSLLFLNLVGGKPVSSLQSLKDLLEEESNAPYRDSEETEVQRKELNAENAAFTKASLPVLEQIQERGSTKLFWRPTGKDWVVQRARLLNGKMEFHERAGISPYLNSSGGTYLFKPEKTA